MDDDQYFPHVALNPKDAEFLRTLLENYDLMEAIYAHKQATGKWAMGSGEALGTEEEAEADSMKEGVEHEVNGTAVGGGLEDVDGFIFPPTNDVPPTPNAVPTDGPSARGGASSSSGHGRGKRKRKGGCVESIPFVLDETSAMIFSKMSDAVVDLAGSVRETVHSEMHPDLNKSVMDLEEFDLTHKLAVIDYEPVLYQARCGHTRCLGQPLPEEESRGLEVSDEVWLNIMMSV